MHRLVKTITRTLSTIMVGGTLTFMSSAAVPAGAAPEKLPILRLDYFAGNGGELAATLDPAYANSAADADTVQLTNAGLVRTLPSGKVVPDLATWGVSSNHLVYTFRLRANARFSSGKLVTAADAEYSLRRALSPATASDSAPLYLGAIKGAAQYSHGEAKGLAGVSVLRRRVLRIVLSEPDASFLTMLAYPAADVLDPQTVKSSGAVANTGALSHVCNSNRGAGPFKFVCWHDRSDFGSSFFPVGQPPSYTLIPNPYYYGARPNIEIVLPAIDSQEHAYRAYLSGKLDVTPVPLTAIGQWIGRTQYLQYPTAAISFLIPNARVAPFDDVHCRRALAYGVDRRRLAQTVSAGIGEPVYDMVPSGVPGNDGGAGTPHLDPTTARAELMQCAGRAAPVSLVYRAGSTLADATYGAIVAMMRDIGFNARLDMLKPDAWLPCTSGNAALSQCQIQLAATTWERYHPDARDYAGVLRCGAGENIGGWCNSTFDRLLDRAALEWDAGRRARLYLQAQQLALADGALIPLLEQDAHELIKPYVRGLTGTVASPNLLPRNGDWSQVAVARAQGG